MVLNCIVEAVITEDSDYLPYGCPKIIFKFNPINGSCEYFEHDWDNKPMCDFEKFEKLSNVTYPCDLDFNGFSSEMFIRYCLVLGCDYLDTTRGLGVTHAHNLVMHFKDLEQLFKRLETKYGRVDIEDYKVQFDKAYQTYKYSLVFCPNERMLKNLRTLPNDGKERDYLGKLISDDVACHIADGIIHPDSEVVFAPYVPVVRNDEDVQEIENLIKWNKKYKAKITNMDTIHNKRMPDEKELSNSVKRLREENSLLQNTVEAEDSKCNVEMMKKKIIDMEAEVKFLRQRVEKLSHSHLTAQEKAEQERSRLQAEVDQLSQANKEASAKLIAMTDAHRQEIEDLREQVHDRAFREGLKEGRIHGRISGAYLCKSYFLMTPPGQGFLNILVKELSEAYLHSLEFWKRMSEPLIHWISSIVAQCCFKLDMKDRAEEVDVDEIFKLLKKEDTPSLELNSQVSATNPWYLASLRKAAQYMSLSPWDLSSWEKIYFPVLTPDDGKYELLRYIFCETQDIFPLIQMEMAEAEEEAKQKAQNPIMVEGPQLLGAMPFASTPSPNPSEPLKADPSYHLVEKDQVITEATSQEDVTTSLLSTNVDPVNQGTEGGDGHTIS